MNGYCECVEFDDDGKCVDCGERCDHPKTYIDVWDGYRVVSICEDCGVLVEP